MIYIFETEILNVKILSISLQKIYGLGSCHTNFICKKLGFSKNLKAGKLTSDQIFKLIKVIEESGLKITNDLRKNQIFYLKNLISIRSYRGLRRLRGLPVRGQRTHTNAKTAKKLKIYIFTQI